MASMKKATIEKYSDCITEGLTERVMSHKIIKWIGSTDDQFEDIKVCDECRKKLGIPEDREWLDLGDKVRYEYYNR
jgi:intein-encoded DNA endonuclease-like protein